jgi:alpha-glucosidase
MTANVAAQANDRASMLNLYRKLIHLRSSNAALAAGELIPVDAGNDAVTAFIRRDGANVVLVVANLGTAPLSGVTVSSNQGAVPVGNYTARDLLGGSAGAPLDASGDGTLREYAPVATLAPLQAYILELKPVRR